MHSSSKVILSELQEEKNLDINVLILKIQSKFPEQANVANDILETAKYISPNNIKILLDNVTVWEQLSDFNSILHSLNFWDKLDELLPILIKYSKIILTEMREGKKVRLHPLHSACLCLQRINELNKENLVLLLSEKKYWSNINDICTAFSNLYGCKLDTRDSIDLILDFPDKASEVATCIFITFEMSRPKMGRSYHFSKEEYYSQLRQQFLNNKSAADCHLYLLKFINEKEKEILKNNKKTCRIL